MRSSPYNSQIKKIVWQLTLPRLLYILHVNNGEIEVGPDSRKCLDILHTEVAQISVSITCSSLHTKLAIRRVPDGLAKSIWLTQADGSAHFTVATEFSDGRFGPL